MRRSKRNNFEKELKDSMKRIEDQVLYMCDDTVGYVELIAKELDLSARAVKRILQNLERRGLIIKETGGWVSYITTERGKRLLKQRGPYK